MIINDGYIFLFYDLPMKTKKDYKKYAIFRSRIVNRGYIMLQESVYYKYLRDLKHKNDEDKFIKSIAINKSNIISLKLTSLQFNNIEKICGDFNLKDLSTNIVEY